jgi:hypothetical protein
MEMEATEINLTVTMIESSSWLSSILKLSTVSFSSMEMEATKKKDCYNYRVVLLAVLHPQAFHCLLILDRNGGH